MAYDLGDQVALSINIKDSAGALANATTVTITITSPDGTTATTTITPTSTGVYTHTATPTQIGRHLVRWVATGDNASSYTDAFTVNDPADLSLLSLTDAKAYLNITSTSSDEELRQFIVEATDIAERLTSRQLRRKTFTEVTSVSGFMLSPINTPILSVTSVTENGTALVQDTDFEVDIPRGLIIRGTSTAPMYWQPGRNNITVVYVAGEANPSPTAQLLVKEITRHLWRTQRGASPMMMGGNSDEQYVPGQANVVTYRIQELADLISVPGFA